MKTYSTWSVGTIKIRPEQRMQNIKQAKKDILYICIQQTRRKKLKYCLKLAFICLEKFCSPLIEVTDIPLKTDWGKSGWIASMAEV
jgi:hypothetical protein